MRCIVLLSLVAMLLTACGKRGALIYPDMLLPAAPANVAARQVGRGVKLSFNLVAKDRAGRDLKDLGGATVFKRTTLAGQGPNCNACTQDFVLFKKLYLDPSPLEQDVQRSGNSFVLLDGSVSMGDECSYIVKAFTKDSVNGQTSQPVTVELVALPLAPELKAVPDPVEIHLHFSAEPLVRGTLVGYNLFRAPKGEPLPFKALNKEPITASLYVDSGLDRTLSYAYAARTVVKMPNGQLVESELSDVVITKLTDE